MKYKVWWIPQVPGKPFEVPVDSPLMGAKIIRTLADYDLFQYHNNIKPDYCNAGGLLELDKGGEWIDWYDEEIGEDDPLVLLEKESANPT